MSTRGILVALILTATAAFVVGVGLERHATHNEVAETPARRAAEGNSAASTTHDEAGERGTTVASAASGASGESAEHDDSTTTTAATTTTTEPAEPATTAHPEASEEVLGVDPESTALLVVAVAVSLLLAAGVWRLGASPPVLGVVALAMAACAALDIREALHQADESHTGLMWLAALIALLHLAAGVLAARAAVTARGAQPPPASAHAA